MSTSSDAAPGPPSATGAANGPARRRDGRADRAVGDPGDGEPVAVARRRPAPRWPRRPAIDAAGRGPGAAGQPGDEHVRDRRRASGRRRRRCRRAPRPRRRARARRAFGPSSDRAAPARPRAAGARREQQDAGAATRTQAAAHATAKVTRAGRMPSAAASSRNASASRARRAASQPSSSPIAAATRSTAPRRCQQVARRGQPQPRAPQQHVAHGARLLAPRGVDGLGEQVGAAGDDRLGELGPGASASTSWATWP